MDFCIIVPTYNNEKTLEKVLTSLLELSKDVIVVNDGSTDNTALIIQKFISLHSISYPVNKGKGYALKKGFGYAINQGYRYAVTIDSDGQHYADDINAFIQKVRLEPDTMIVGNRILPIDKMSKGSSFANRFSNFWFRLITGIELQDTQTGFRLYPLKEIKGMKFFTNKYEFELEILVRLAWKGVGISSIPVKVYYPSKEERVSHFRPFKDFFRISVLNTIFVILMLLYVKPLSVFKNLKKSKIKDFINFHVIHTRDSNFKIIASVAFGIFMGVIPIWGFQLISAIALAFLFRLNKFLVIVAANISIFPLTPFIMYLSYVTGGLVMQQESTISFSRHLTFEAFKGSLFQYIFGSFVFGLILSVLSGIITFVVLKMVRRRGAE